MINLLFEMPWAEPNYSNEEVNWAGAVLSGSKWDGTHEQYFKAIDIINNWRASHYFPLNTFQMTLRNKARQIYGSALVAQRIKRLSSIDHKLKRFEWLRLSEMQDIGGCRVVLRSVPQVDELVRRYKASDIKHRLVDEDATTLETLRSLATGGYT